MNLNALNSLTKYPSIPTYHPMGERGRLQEDGSPRFTAGDSVIVTEKIDGTNTRIIVLPGGDWFVGSREELLTAKGDRIANLAQQIVDAVRPWADEISANPDNHGYVFFGESYGGRITGNSKQYTGIGSIGFRVFDVMRLNESALSRLTMPLNEIAVWRDAGGQSFLDDAYIEMMCNDCGIERVPVLAGGDASALPLTIGDTSAWLANHIQRSRATLDTAAQGRPEGVVIRNTDRSRIYKVRFEDYARTLRK